MRVAIHLAFKELWRNRTRFLLFSLVVALITVLILFIAALGEGLGSGNREYLAKLNADLIVYQDTARLVIASSRIGCDTRTALRGLDGVVDVGAVGFSSVSLVGADDADGDLDISLIGVEPGKPGQPPVVSGQGLVRKSADEALVDRTVAQVMGLGVGGLIVIRSPQGGDDEFYQMRVIGVTDSRKYGLRPSVFVPIVTWDKVRPKARQTPGQEDPSCNVAMVRLEDPDQLQGMRQRIEASVNGVEAVDRKTAYQNTPGYSAQQSTLTTQNTFALLIGVLVIGGFFQIQTLQKVPQIGMLKAIGASSGIVATAVLLQILGVTLAGVLIGSLVSFSLSLAMPANVPIVFEPRSSLIAIASILLMGPIGGLVSIRYSLRVEPLIALGLGT